MSFRLCTWLLISLLCLLSGCSDGASDPPPLPDPGPLLPGPQGSAFLEQLLRDPPRVSPKLRTTLARELRDRFRADGSLDSYGQELVRIARLLEAEGLLSAGELFAQELRAGEQAAVASLYAPGADSLRLAFFRQFVQPAGAMPVFGYVLHPPEAPDAAGRIGLDRVLRLAAGGLERLHQERLVLLVALFLQRQALDIGVLTRGHQVLQSRGLLPTWDLLLRQAGIEPAGLCDDARVPQELAESLVDAASLQALEKQVARTGSELDAALALLDGRISELDQQIVALSGRLMGLSAEVVAAADELHSDMAELIEQDPALSVSERRVTLQLVQETLFDGLPLDERIRSIEAGEGAYQYVTENNRTKMTNKLKRHEKRKEKLKKVHKGTSDALEAGRDVMNLLTASGLVSQEDANTVHRALDLTAAGLQVAAGLASGNPFAVISGASNIVMIAFGLEPPPDPAQVRHEQVMAALEQLARGQQAILDNLVVLSEQVQELHMELHQVHEIVRSTHAIVVDENLAGLRDCREFLANLAYYAVEVPDPATGEPVGRPDLGVMNYTQFLAHFSKQQEKELYTSCNRFLNDQVRADVLNILKVAEDDEEAAGLRAAIGRNLGKKPDWVQGQLLQDQQRIAGFFKILTRIIEPKYHARLLGSLIHPAKTYEELNAKLARLLDDEASRPWEEAYEELELGEALREYYNPLMIEEIVRSTQELQDYRLIQVPGSEAMPDFEAFARPGYDPAGGFGGSRRAQHGQLLKSLTAAEKLLCKSIAQNTLLTGDVLLPVLAYFAFSESSWNSDVVKVAYPLLEQNAALRENAVRYLVYGRLAEDPERFFELRELARQLLRKHLQGIREDDRYIIGEQEAFNGDHARAVYAEYSAQAAPQYREPIGLVQRNADGSRTVVRRGWPDYYLYQRFYRGLNLKGDLPRDLNKARRALRGVDERMSGPFVVEHRWNFSRAPTGLYTRLPRVEEVAAGKLISVDLLPALERRYADLRRQLIEYTIAFPPDAQSGEQAARLHRGLLLRELVRVVGAP